MYIPFTFKSTSSVSIQPHIMDAEIEEMIARLRDWEVCFPEIVRR